MAAATCVCDAPTLSAIRACSAEVEPGGDMGILIWFIREVSDCRAAVLRSGLVVTQGKVTVQTIGL